jgi:hypothetical protein
LIAHGLNYFVVKQLSLDFQVHDGSILHAQYLYLLPDGQWIALEISNDTQ